MNQMGNMGTEDQSRIVRSGYDSISKAYLEVRHQDSEDVRLLPELMHRLSDGARILDAGCGAGMPVTKLLSERFDVVGIDFSEAQVDLAKRNVPDAEFLCRDMTDLSFEDDSFDAVCSYYAIIHIPRKLHQGIFDRFFRLLKPSGLALLCLGAGDLEEDYVDDYLGAPMFWSHFDAETNLAILKTAGFDLIWHRVVADATSPGSGHLFVLAQKPE